MTRKFWLLRGLRFLLFAAIFVAAIGFITMYLWNWLIPYLFHLPELSLGQTYGLLLLSRILFGGFRGKSKREWAKHRAWKQRMAGKFHSLTPEEKSNFRQQMRARCSAGWMRTPETSAEPAAQA